ncbi:MAG: 6-phosphogluconolactonase [Gammaproteobacteria bacterium]|jgi:6-phosphogluconolactonase|nr:6-phosphogluconolactonase [Gammaproteobacteria bacterium]
MNHRREIHIGSDADAVVQTAAACWEAASAAAIRARGVCHVALAGGSTPRALYELLARPPWRERIDWSRHYFWFGDERCVPPDHPDSNYRMARETLLSHIAVDAERVHRIRGEIDPALAAREYEDALRRTVATDEGATPALDLVLLGLGTDGHVASLFPGTDILAARGNLVAAVWVPRLASWRVSLTLPVINAARRVALLVTGSGKADIVAQVIGAESHAYPAGLVQPSAGVDWYLDRAAAAGIEPKEPGP